MSLSLQSQTGEMGFQLGPNAKFAVCAVGIFVCFFYFGILQEKM